MPKDLFILASGTYTSEQDVLASLDTFITSNFANWIKYKTVTDTASDKNIVYYSKGKKGYDDRWVSFRATSDNLQFHSYSYFNSATDIGSDDLYTVDTAVPCGATTGTYWFLGSAECIYVSVQHNGASEGYTGGIGAWATYYGPGMDPKPFFTFGQTNTSTLFDASPSRCRSYGPGSFGDAYVATLSGTIRDYSINLNTNVKYSGPQSRTGKYYNFKPVFYCDGPYPFLEVRGEMPGLFLVGSSTYTNGAVTPIHNALDISSDYVIQLDTASNGVACCFGKII